MNTSDFLKLGVGFALGGMMSRSIASAFSNAASSNAIDTRASMNALTVPQTRREIQALLDKLDVRLANGEISETIYKTLADKWDKRLRDLP